MCPDSDEPELLNTLKAHRSAVNSVALSSDGEKLVSGSDDGSVIFWNLQGSKAQETGLCYRLTGHKEAINSVDYSAQDDFFVSASKDTTVRLWRLNGARNKPNEEPIVYKCHPLNVRHVNLSPSGHQFCTSSDDKTVKIWDANHRNKFLASLLGHTNWVRCARFCPSNPSMVASCGDDCQILTHDIRLPGRAPAIYTVSGAKGRQHSYAHFTTLDWYPLSDFLVAVGSSDASTRVYDMRQGKIIQYYEAHNGPIESVEFHKSGKYLISGGSDGIIKIYDLLEGRVLFTITAHKGAVKSIKFSRSSETFASSGNDKAIYLWKANLIDTEGDCGSGDAAANGTSFNEMSISPLKVHSRETTPKRYSSGSGRESLPNTTATLNSSRAASRGGSSLSLHHDLIDSPESVRYEGRHEKSSRASSSRSNLAARSTNHCRARESEHPEHNLLQGIVTQISNLTEAISLLEKRISIVESMVEGNATTTPSTNATRRSN